MYLVHILKIEFHKYIFFASGWGSKGVKRTLKSFLHPKIHHAKLTHTKVVEGIKLDKS